MAPKRSPEQLAAERWLLQRGLPFVLHPTSLLRRVWSRSAPALAAFAVLMASSILIVVATGEHTIDIDGSPTRTEWFVLVVVVLVAPVAALTGWLVSRLSTWRSRGVASTVSVGIAGLGAVFGGPSSLIFVDLVLDVVVIAVIFLCTATGVGAILAWAARMTWENLASIGGLFVRALPVMLLTVLVFFNGPAWTMASTVSRGRLWTALLFLMLTAAVFLFSRTRSRAEPILHPPVTDAENTDSAMTELAGTPFERLPSRSSRRPALSRLERMNVMFVLGLSQLVQVLIVAMVTGLIFLSA